MNATRKRTFLWLGLVLAALHSAPALAQDATPDPSLAPSAAAQTTAAMLAGEAVIGTHQHAAVPAVRLVPSVR